MLAFLRLQHSHPLLQLKEGQTLSNYFNICLWDFLNKLWSAWLVSWHSYSHYGINVLPCWFLYIINTLMPCLCSIPILVWQFNVVKNAFRYPILKLHGIGVVDKVKIRIYGCPSNLKCIQIIVNRLKNNK